MEPFADVNDLESRWRVLDESEKERAGVLLNDASAYLFALLDYSDIPVDTENEIQKSNLKMVCCAMVRRIMGIDEKLFGVTQFSQTAGSFTEMATASNPSGDMYLTNSEKLLLGLPLKGKKQKGSFFRVAIHKPDGSLIDEW